jgi:cell division septation protein DedD
VASLQSRSDARDLSSKLAKRGWRTEVVAAAGPKGKLYRVRVGPYADEQAARSAASRLEKNEKLRQTWIVTE